MKNIRFVLAVLALLAACGASAQTYPNKPIRFVVPFAAGGGVDVTVRTIVQRMTALGQPLLVDNRTGAGGSVAADVVAKAAPDGYTFLATTSGHTILPHLQKVAWDPVKDFVPVTTLVAYPLMLAAHHAVPANSLVELVAYAKTRPGTLNYGTGGVGTPPHLAMELLKSMAGLDIVHVAFKGNGPATTALLAGDIQLMLDTMIGSMPGVRAGKLKGLAVTSAGRSAIAPEIPTMREAGLPGYEFEGWTGVFAPGGTPRAIVDRMNTELAKALLMQDVKDRLVALGYEPKAMTPEQFAILVERDLAKIGKIVKDARIQVD